eukprot:COSAG05_NODE_4503_length_1487_cov_1.832853_4_plen_66_part_01
MVTNWLTIDPPHPQPAQRRRSVADGERGDQLAPCQHRHQRPHPAQVQQEPAEDDEHGQVWLVEPDL